MANRVFGEIPGIYEGFEFKGRLELSLSLVHLPRQAGISGSQQEGADSIVLSGGYEDDEDLGNEIIYTGHGGRDISSGKQIADQELVRQNLALALNCQRGLPVRVIRGANHKSKFSPKEGYRYDGLFRVEKYWREKGKREHHVWRFRLTKIALETSAEYDHLTASNTLEESDFDYTPAKRSTSIIQRIVRDTEKARLVKELYNFCCQICGNTLITSAGKYCEAAHIKPLGRPHNGPDTIDNIICLCPNHHVMFDFGGFAIADDLTLIGEEGSLILKAGHEPNREFIKYHREHFYIG